MMGRRVQLRPRTQAGQVAKQAAEAQEAEPQRAPAMQARRPETPVPAVRVPVQQWVPPRPLADGLALAPRRLPPLA